MVVHGHVLVNGQKVDRPSYSCRSWRRVTSQDADPQDRPREHGIDGRAHVVPGWMDVSIPPSSTASCLTMPTSEQIPFDVNTNLIVEFYR
jgi:small subunit ribosomal protein S4